MTTLDQHIAAEAEQTESYFRAALAREDALRLAKLRELAREADSYDAFAKQAPFVGWTPGDLRSKELAEPLAPLLDALWAEKDGDIDDERLLDAWHAFNAERMRILIHCL
ncbi:hypothetical protein RXV95_08500 [Novosphingobium sp. ZN18A2]|uniref:hypothetical protein n=1 Tax=Novosphingobium sp. ZN18A2 TaxID=3079861 RepID=UPI0030CD6C47